MASARVIVPCPVGVWTIVATNVTTAIISKKITGPDNYYHNYALTGTDAPTTLADGILMTETTIEYNNSVAIDIYIWTQGVAGSVGVDA